MPGVVARTVQQSRETLTGIGESVASVWNLANDNRLARYVMMIVLFTVGLGVLVYYIEHWALRLEPASRVRQSRSRTSSAVSGGQSSR